MFENYEKNIEMLKGAYRKYKSYYFYNKNLLIMRKKISDFESDENKMEEVFSNLAKLLMNSRDVKMKEYLNSIINTIDFIVLPKKFETDNIQNNRPVSNTISRNKKLKNVNFFIDAHIEVYILDTLWTVLLSKIVYDNDILSYDVYGNTINVSSLFQGNEINYTSRILFNRYFNKYSNWRNKAFEALEKNYDKKTDSVLISLDIKSYFYSAIISFDDLKSLFRNHNFFDEIKSLTKIMENVYKKYYNVIIPFRLDLPILKKHSYILPIGLFSSMILGNVYLSEFDKKVRSCKEISYYGRYVDDMLFVVKKNVSKDTTNSSLIDDILVKNKLLEKDELDYSIVGIPNLNIQSEKIKTLYIDHNESKAIIDIYNDTIKIIPSQMDPLPNNTINLNNFDEVAYTVENFTKEKKIRDIGRMGVNSFKVGRYFSGLTYRYAHVSTFGTINKEIDEHIFQISKFFVGSQGIEFYSNWLNYLYFLVLTQRYKQLRNFCISIRNQVNYLKGNSLDKKMYRKCTSINKKVKDALIEHINICMALALSLDIDMVNRHFKSMEHTVKKYIHSNMFDHNLIAFPLANYLIYTKDISYIKMDVKDLGKIPTNIDKEFKFVWSPRFIHYDELILLLFYYYHRHGNRVSNFDYLKRELIEKYCQINHMSYQPFNIEYGETVSFEEYKLDSIYIQKDSDTIPNEVNIAVGSVWFDQNKCMKGCKRWDNISIEEKNTLDEILRESYRCLDKKKGNVMILALPELYFPIYWIGELIRFSKRSQIAIVTGLQYMNDNTGKMRNYVATLLPFTSGKKNYKNVYVHIREKNDYSPIEFEGLAHLGYKCENTLNANYQVFNWNNVRLSSLVCYELTDVMVRGLLKGRCDIIIASVFNPDTTYFSNIIDSTVRDLHTFVVQANTSFYGDSRVTGPYDRDSKDIFKIKGGENDHIVVGSISFREVKEFEKKYNENLEKRVQTIYQKKKIKKVQKKRPDIKPLSARFKRKDM